MRKCSEEGTFRPELVRKEGDDGGSSIVRELHVYGTAVPVHGRDPTKFQHQVSTDQWYWKIIPMRRLTALTDHLSLYDFPTSHRWPRPYRVSGRS